MAKKLASKQAPKKQETPAIQIILYWITTVYIVITLGILPLYTPDAYYSIGDNKWKFWIYSTTAYLCIIALVLLVYFIVGMKCKITGITSIKESIKNNFSLPDYFAIGYLVMCIISSIFSPYKENIWMGAPGWNMGLWSQLCFILTYFAISRTWQYSNTVMRVCLASSTLVFFFGVLNRFEIDVLGFYVGLNDTQKFDYLSTLGQTSWYSSFLCLILPVMIMTYYVARTGFGKIISAILLVIAFMSTVTQNSDSAYLAFAAYMFVLFWVSLEDNKKMLRFLEICIIALVSFKIIGIIQLTHPDNRGAQLDAISMTMSTGAITWIALIVVAALYVILFRGELKGISFTVRKIIGLRYVILSLGVLAVIGGVCYIVMNTKGTLPENLQSDNMYLYFNDQWGNHRGMSWRAGFMSFVREDFVYKLIGNGPDEFGAVVYEQFYDELEAYFSGLVLYCAHNEWLHTLVCEGILGLICYAGMYITSYMRCLKNKNEHPELIGIAMAIAAYAAHNLFCYQQVICTSAIIALMGMGDALIRRGHVEADAWEEPSENRGGHKSSMSEIFKQFMSA